jgi:hypothetical protein
MFLFILGRVRDTLQAMQKIECAGSKAGQFLSPRDAIASAVRRYADRVPVFSALPREDQAEELPESTGFTTAAAACAIMGEMEWDGRGRRRVVTAHESETA